MTRSSRFWDRIAARYARKPIADEAAYQKKLAVTRQYLSREMRLLEIGCGTGSTAISHAPFVKEIHAIDISQRMLEIARSRAKAAGVENVHFERSDVAAFSAPNGAYDAVLGLSILHLLEDRTAAITMAHRVLKPGGVFVSSTVCLGDKMRWFKFVGPVGRILGVMPVVRVFTFRELVESLEVAGFAIDYQWQPGGGRVAFIVGRK